MNWKKDFARDLIAIGGIPFWILVSARAFVLDARYYPWQFIIGGAIVLALTFLFKSDVYSGLALVLAFFTSLYYDDVNYTIVILISYLLLLGALIYVGKKKMNVIKGVAFGFVGTTVSWWLVKLFFF